MLEGAMLGEGRTNESLSENDEKEGGGDWLDPSGWRRAFPRWCAYMCVSHSPVSHLTE